MIAIPLCIYFAFKINELAKRKGKNIVLWIITAILAFFATLIIGTAFVTTLFYNGSMSDIKEMETFFQNPLRIVFVWVAGFGGYLLVRYILERMPDVNKTKKPD